VLLSVVSSGVEIVGTLVRRGATLVTSTVTVAVSVLPPLVTV
jgi:hypothetical protein